MHVLHENEEIKSRVAECLHQASPGALALLQADCIAFDTVMCQLPLLRGEPTCCQWCVGKEKDADYGDPNGNNAFKKLTYDCNR